MKTFIEVAWEPGQLPFDIQIEATTKPVETQPRTRCICPQPKYVQHCTEDYACKEFTSLCPRRTWVEPAGDSYGCQRPLSFFGCLGDAHLPVHASSSPISCLQASPHHHCLLRRSQHLPHQLCHSSAPLRSARKLISCGRVSRVGCATCLAMPVSDMGLRKGPRPWCSSPPALGLGFWGQIWKDKELDFLSPELWGLRVMQIMWSGNGS